MAEIRKLRESDLEVVYELSTTAGWNQTKADWGRLLRLDPAGCFGIEEEGRVVSTATAIRYGSGLAWIGMVLTLPQFRGRGFARRLMTHALGWLDSQGVVCSMLDATEMGQPLYEKLGFVPDYPIERWMRRPSEQKPPEITLQPFSPAQWANADRDAFGADRTLLLDLLSGGKGLAMVGQGYALVRPGRIASYFGPCIAADVDVARTLLMSSLAAAQGSAVIWDLIPANPQMGRLARAFGFDPMRHMTRMRRGGEYAPPSPRVVALAGLEYG